MAKNAFFNSYVPTGFGLTLIATVALVFSLYVISQIKDTEDIQTQASYQSQSRSSGVSLTTTPTNSPTPMP